MFSLCAGISLFDCFEWALIDCIVKCRGHSELWQFQPGGSICLWCLHVFSMCWYFLISSYYLTVSNGHSLTALKSIEVTQSSDSFIWGGPSVFGICILIYTGISLYFLISWLPLVSTCFLCTGISLYLPIILTVSNGHSLTALKSVEVTQSSDSFIQGGSSMDTLTNKQSDLKSRSLH